MMTLREAIYRQADNDGYYLQDNAHEPWSADNLEDAIRTHANDADAALGQPVYYDGETIRAVKPDGYIDTASEPLYRMVPQSPEQNKTPSILHGLPCILMCE